MVQTIRPASTISSGSWSPIGAATMHETTDETSQDGDTTRNEMASGAGTFEVKLDSATDPSSSIDHTIHIWGKAVGSGGPENVDVSLYQGTTLIVLAINNWGPGRSSYGEGTFTLTALQADAISDYTDLRIRVAENAIGGGSERFNVTQIYMEIPDASAAITIAVGTFALAAALGSTIVLNPKIVTVVAFTLALAMGSVTVSVSGETIIGVNVFASTLAAGNVIVLNPKTISVNVFSLTSSLGSSVLNPKIIGANAFALAAAIGNVTVSVAGVITINVNVFALTGAVGSAVALNPKIVAVSVFPLAGAISSVTVIRPRFVTITVFALTGALGNATVINPKTVSINVFALTGALVVSIIRPRFVSVNVFAATLAVGSVSITISRIIGVNVFALAGVIESATITNPKFVSANVLTIAGSLGAVSVLRPRIVSSNVFTVASVLGNAVILIPKTVGVSSFALALASSAIITNPKVITANGLTLASALGNTNVSTGAGNIIVVSVFGLVLTPENATIILMVFLVSSVHASGVYNIDHDAIAENGMAVTATGEFNVP